MTKLAILDGARTGIIAPSAKLHAYFSANLLPIALCATSVCLIRPAQNMASVAAALALAGEAAYEAMLQDVVGPRTRDVKEPGGMAGGTCRLFK